MINLDRNFGGVIWTNHALSRLKERNTTQSDAYATWRNPSQSRKGTNNSWIYYRTYGEERIEVVAKKDEKGKWIILSVWSKKVEKEKSFFTFFLKKIFGN